MAKVSKRAESKNRIILVDDHPVFRNGLANLLNAEDDLTVCGEAGNAKAALESILKLKPALAVVDLRLPGMSGLELIKEIRALNIPTKLLVVSMFDEALYADRVLRAGGDGYIMKQEDSEEIVHAIRDVLAGHIYVSEEVFSKRPARVPVARLVGSLDQLTDSELEVLELLGLGKSTREIAAELSLANSEVKGLLTRLREKLRSKNMNELIRYAVCWVEESRN